MKKKLRFKNPINIYLDKNGGFILDNKTQSKNLSLEPGVMFNANHYGFILITSKNGKQIETVYPTENKVMAVGIEDGGLIIVEDEKSLPWRFNKSGDLEVSLYDNVRQEDINMTDVILDHSNMLMGVPISKNPIRVRLDRNPEKCLVLGDEKVSTEYPLIPGVMIGDEHYGFVLVSDTDNGQKEVCYSTQNKVDGLCIENRDGKQVLKIYEDGKYHPWVFSVLGEFVEEASYNQYSRRDIEYIEKTYEMNSKSAKDSYSIKVKK